MKSKQFRTTKVAQGVYLELSNGIAWSSSARTKRKIKINRTNKVQE
jgi:hypothetical protein